MPKLPNPKHELFARHLAKGKSQAEAYRLAGFAEDDANASRLATGNDGIVQRVKDLQAAAARRSEISVEWVLVRMKKLAEHSDPKARAKALDMLAKYLAMYEHTKRIEHSGKVAVEQVNLEGLAPEKFDQLRAIMQEAQKAPVKRSD